MSCKKKKKIPVVRILLVTQHLEIERDAVSCLYECCHFHFVTFFSLFNGISIPWFLFLFFLYREVCSDHQHRNIWRGKKETKGLISLSDFSFKMMSPASCIIWSCIHLVPTFPFFLQLVFIACKLTSCLYGRNLSRSIQELRFRIQAIDALR